jgi:hypothetical protein
LKPNNTIEEILDALASQNRQGNTSLIFRLEPNLIQDAMNALRGYRKVFAPVISGLTDTSPICAAYERMRQADGNKDVILLLVECQTAQEFREALAPLPIRHSSEWRFLDQSYLLEFASSLREQLQLGSE